MENYLKQIPNFKVRQNYTKFRVSNHSLNIEKGRHNKIPKELRFCPFCSKQIETEIHFLIQCDSYKEPRQVLFKIVNENRPSFVYYTTTEKFLFIISEEYAQLTAKFVQNCFSIREFLNAKHRNEI